MAIQLTNSLHRTLTQSLVATLLLSGPAWAQFYNGEQFSQLDFLGTRHPVEANTLWGRYSVMAQGSFSSINYINVVANDGVGGPPAWIVRNLPIPTSFDQPGTQLYHTTFDLGAIGFSPGDDVTSIQFYSQMTSFPQTTAPSGPMFFFPVSNQRFDAQGDNGIDGPRSNPGVPIDLSFLNFTFPMAKANYRDNMPNVETGWMQCGPASAANSLAWMAAEYGLPIPTSPAPLLHRLKDVNHMKTNQVTANGSRVSPPDWPGTQHANFVIGKLQYVSENNLPIVVKYQSTEPQDGDVEHAGELARHKGAPTWDFISQEINNGEDVELRMSWLAPEGFADIDGNGMWDPGEPFVDANMNGQWDPDGQRDGGHSIVLAGKIDLLGARGVWYRDDKEQSKIGGIEGVSFSWIATRPDGTLELVNADGRNEVFMAVSESVDSDGDGASDGEETNQFGSNPFIPDSDGDGLSDGAEVFDHHTSPNNPNTDGDTLGDADEVAHPCLDPNANDSGLDADGDGLNNAFEVAIGTNPCNVDSDADGIPDGIEFFFLGTDPHNADSDFDGIPDGYELAHPPMSPTTPDGGADADGDGLSNLLEYQKGTNPNLNDSDGDGHFDGADYCPTVSNPRQEDGDGDGVGNECDNSPSVFNPDQTDTDGDGEGDASDDDDDEDSMTDIEEARNGTNPLVVDTDGDGLNDFQEDFMGTNPLWVDTDGDGISDGEEVERGLNPLSTDSDGDGLSDTDEEFFWATDPAKADTDWDGLNDFHELVIGLDPLTNDSDCDGMLDGWEQANGLNPLDPSDAEQDPDGDGLSNLAEEGLGTNPHMADTDGDGLDDKWEWENGLDPLNPDDALVDPDGDGLNNALERFFGTNPHDPDTDDDGLTDGDETMGFPFTDPLNPDSDGDGLTDGEEVLSTLTNPNDPDTDDDGILDGADNCPTIPNTVQFDFDNDNQGDACDCGDTLVVPGEECDDGNTMSGDGCNSMCIVEEATPCFTVVDCRLDPNDNACNCAACVSGVCVFSCSRYGNVNCSGNVNLDDILCCLSGFSNFANCPNADIAPCGGNGIISLDDILGALSAFAGANPCGCELPSMPPGNPPLCGSNQP